MEPEEKIPSFKQSRRLVFDAADASAYASQGSQPKAAGRGAGKRGGGGYNAGGRGQPSFNRAQTARNFNQEAPNRQHARGGGGPNPNLKHPAAYNSAQNNQVNQKKKIWAPAADNNTAANYHSGSKWRNDRPATAHQQHTQTRQKVKAPATQKRFVEQSKNFNQFGKMEAPGSGAQSHEQQDEDELNHHSNARHDGAQVARFNGRPPIVTQQPVFDHHAAAFQFMSKVTRMFKTHGQMPQVHITCHEDAVELFEQPVVSPEQAKELEDDLIDLLAAVDSKTAMLPLVMGMVKDVRVIADEIQLAKLAVTAFNLKNAAEIVVGEEQQKVLNAAEQSVEQLMALPKLNTIDGTLGQLQVSALDYVLKSRREHLKELSSTELAEICRTLLDLLLAQDQAVFHLVTLMTANDAQLTQSIKPDDLVTWRGHYDELLREACLRFLSQICQENGPSIPDDMIKVIYKCASRIAFLPAKLHRKCTSGFYRTLRAAYNTIANLLAQEEPSSFVRSKNEEIFRLLRREFDYLMSKVRHNHKSRRFVSQTTTVLRALQFSMNLGEQEQQKSQASNPPESTNAAAIMKMGQTEKNGKILLPDADAVSLFINFYKLLFLGTKFSKRMLKIDVQSSAVQDLAQKIGSVAEASGFTDEESALSDMGGSLLFETSDQGGGKKEFGADSSDEGWLGMNDEDIDPYQKIKLQANMCMRNLLKNNSKILFNYWYYMFPSFMFKPPADLTQLMINFEKNALQPEKLSDSQLKARMTNMNNFQAFVFEFSEVKEPTLFFLIRQSSTQSQLKSSIYATIGQMLEQSSISKHALDLEDKDIANVGKEGKAQGMHQMIDYLGRFLRSLHYMLMAFLIEGAQIANMYPTAVNNYASNNSMNVKSEGQKRFFDRQTYIQIIRTIKVLLQFTPYQVMRQGLASITVQSLIENLKVLDRLNNRDQLLRNEIFTAINAGISRAELTSEIIMKFMQIEEDKSLSDTLLYTLMKVQNFISNEKIAILQTLGKNYPKILTTQWLRIEKGYQMPKIQNFFVQTLQKIERKKVNLILKIIEDLLKNYQVLNHVDSNDEKVLQTEINDISVREAAITAQQKANAMSEQGYQAGTELTPYDNDVFCAFLLEVVNMFIFSQPIDGGLGGNLQRTQTHDLGMQQPPPVFSLEINTTISVLNLVCIMNHDQFHRVFRTQKQINQLLNFLDEVLNVSKALSKAQMQQKTMHKGPASSAPFVPSILKAAIIKTYGYLIQHQKHEEGGLPALFTEAPYVTNTILGHCLSQQILNDSNVNVQIRNSWTLSFICSLYPLDEILKSKSLDVQAAINSTESAAGLGRVNQGPGGFPQFTPNMQHKVHNNWQQAQINTENVLIIEPSNTIAECNLALLINGLVKYTQHQASNKEKVTASSIRALGFIVQSLIQMDFDAKNVPGIKPLISTECLDKAVRLVVGIIVEKISGASERSCTPKVVWNICVALSKIVSCFNKLHRIDVRQDYSSLDYSSHYLVRVFSFETTQSLLKVFMEGQNYKTKIHACQTLMNYVNLNQYGFLDAEKNPENLLELFWRHIQEQLKYQINQTRMPVLGLVSEQSAYVEQIDRSFISFWAHVCDLTSMRLLCPSTSDQFSEQRKQLAMNKDDSKHHSTMLKFFNDNTYDLLQSIIMYLRRELRVPEYSDFFEENEEFTAEDFQKETLLIFQQNALLYPKLHKLQSKVISKIFDIVACEGSEVHVSFFVYESLQCLVKSDIVTEWRGLEMLRQVRSFNPSQY